MKIRIRLLPVMALALAAAAPAYADNAESQGAAAHQWSRLVSQAWPLREANADLCPNSRGTSLGLMIGGALDEHPVVMGVGADSPAARAGIAPRDELVSIGGRAIRGKSQEAVAKAYDEAIGGLQAGTPVAVEFRRDGAVQTATATPALACSFDVVYTHLPAPPSVQGTQLLIGSQYDALMQTDEQVRMVLSRFLARAILDHSGEVKSEGRKWEAASTAMGFLTGMGSPVSGNAIAKMRNGERMDLEADHLSVYLLARAGTDVNAVPEFWAGVWAQQVQEPGMARRLLGRVTNQSLGSEKRKLELEATRDQVLQLQAAGQPLVPVARTATDEGEQAG